MIKLYAKKAINDFFRIAQRWYSAIAFYYEWQRKVVEVNLPLGNFIGWRANNHHKCCDW